MARPSNAFIGLLSLTGVLLLCTSTALVYLLVSNRQPFGSSGHGEFCLTPECVALGAMISKSINLSADPCEDFYQYACGNFPNQVHYKFQEDGVNLQGVNYVEAMTAVRYELLDRLHEVLTIPLADGESDAEMEKVRQFARSLYQTCQAWWHEWDGGQNASAALVDSLLTGLLLRPDALSQDYWLETLLARIASTGVGGLFRVTVSSSLLESMLSSHQPNSPLRDLPRVFITINVSEVGVWGRVHAGALEHLTQLASSLSPELVEILLPNETVAQLPSVSQGLLRNYASGISDKVITRRVRELREDAAADGHGFKWGVFFDQLMPDGALVDNEALVSVTNSRQTEAFLAYLLGPKRSDTRDRAAKQALLVFDWLLRFRVFLPPEMSAMLDEAWASPEADRKAALVEADRLIVAVPFGAAVGRECMRLTRHLLQPVVESLYRRAYLPSDFESVQRLVGHVKMASADAAQTAGATWMTGQSSVQVAEKILAVRQAIGFEELPPAEVKQLHLPCFDRHAAATEEEEEPDFASVYIAALCAYQTRALQSLTTNFSAPVFGTLNPLSVNAYNYFRENRIIFPLALLQPPLYHASYPAHANMAGLGFIAGHEIGHAFDSFGHALRKDGAKGHIWDAVTEEGYKARMKCLHDDYSSFTAIPELRYSVMDTLNNDVADIIGVSAAFNGLAMAVAADKSHATSATTRLPGVVAQLTVEQIFFVQLAQSWCVKADAEALAVLYGGPGVTHSPNRYRVHGMMRHSPHFAAAFACPADSPMNPTAKCTFW